MLKKHIISRSFSTQTQTIKSLYANGKTKEALIRFFNQPDHFSASYLIEKQQNNLNSSLQIYNAVKNKSISVIAAMANVYKKHKKYEQAQELCRSMICVHTEMKKEGKKMTNWDWDKLIQTLCTCQWNKEGIFFFEEMISQEKVPHAATVYLVLKSLIQMKNLEYITARVIPLIYRWNIRITPQAYNELIKVCSKEGQAKYGEVIHAHLISIGIKNDPFINTTLISMYSKCGKVGNALKLFNETKKEEGSVFTWTAMISGLSANGKRKEALELFEQMQSDGIMADATTFNIILTVCADLARLDIGEKIHKSIPVSLQQGVFVRNALINMYSKCGRLEKAHEIFNAMKRDERDVVSWNAMISGLSANGKGKEALELFEQMQSDGIQGTAVTYNTVLTVCADLARLDIGEKIHKSIPVSLQQGVFVRTALINMYSKCGRLEKAHEIFNAMKRNEKNVVSWNAMISGLSANGKGKEALELFEQMQSDGIMADATTYNTVLTVCADLAYFDIGEKIHKSIPVSLQQGVFVRNALINMYSKCGRLEKAHEIFNAMKRNERDVVSWNAMISGLSANGKGKEALELFEQMQSDGIVADTTTFNIILTVCADLARLDIGEKIHKSIPVSMQQVVLVKNSLISMYSKCGRLEKAHEIFNEMKTEERDCISWNSMISAYGTHGKGRKALELFEQMKDDGVSPTSITFVTLLTACSHSGLIDEAQQLFHSMDKVYGVTPDDVHLNCLIDALGRAGYLEKAEMYMNMTQNLDPVALTTVLGACRFCVDVDRAERIFSKIIALDPSDASAYVTMANIYALAQRPNDANRIRLLMRRKQIKKIPGMTSIVVDGVVHSFTSHDTSHPRTKEIYKALHALHLKMNSAGYEADTSWVTRTDVEEDYSQEEKKQFLCYHSERIAIAFALISTPEGTPITLVKNLRVCGDCHSATKYIARVTGREITVRDASRFHHFSPDGKCSCGDYW